MKSEAATGILEWSAWGIPASLKSTLASMAQTDIAKDIRMYPNPVTGEHLIIESNSQDEATISIYDIHSKLVYQKLFIDNIKINKSDIGSNGMYFIQVKTNDTQFSDKLILQ